MRIIAFSPARVPAEKSPVRNRGSIWRSIISCRSLSGRTSSNPEPVLISTLVSRLPMPHRSNSCVAKASLENREGSLPSFLRPCLPQLSQSGHRSRARAGHASIAIAIATGAIVPKSSASAIAKTRQRMRLAISCGALQRKFRHRGRPAPPL